MIKSPPELKWHIHVVLQVVQRNIFWADRTSGHISCFNDKDKVEKSALSMHAKECHIESFSLETFSISVVKRVSPQQLRREEFKFIDKFRTASLGLNRYKA